MAISPGLQAALNQSLVSPANAAEAALNFNYLCFQGAGNLNIPGALVVFASVNANVSAAGTTQGTATVLAAATNVVTNASGTNGVLLPVPVAVGQEVAIINTSGVNGLLVYADAGGTGGTINGGAANAAVTLASKKGATYICTGLAPSAWWSMSN